jgi:alpha/beta superfamily hydrolase
MDPIPGRALTIPSGDLTLESLLHLPEGDGPFPGAVICHPHPQYGGDMYNNVVGALVRACLDANVAALRFNFRGVGESQGAYDNGAGEQEDARAALDCLKSLPQIKVGRTALLGYSFGAVVALNVASGPGDLAAVVAVSNPTAGGSKPDIHLRAPALLITGDRDQYCDPALLKEYRDQLGDDVTVEVLAGVDHFWWGSDGRLIEIVTGFLQARLH